MNFSLRISIDKILIIFLISLAFFRVDLAGGNAPFLITPQLLLSLVLIILVMLKRGVINTKLKQQSSNIVVGFVIMLAYFFMTIVFGFKGLLQFKKMTLFTEIVISSIAFLYFFNKTNNKRYIIRTWIKGTLIIQIIWLVVQLTLFFTNTHQSNTAEVAFLKYIDPFSAYVGHYFPRLNGGFLDPNVFSYYMSFIFFIGSRTKTIKPLESYFAILLILLSFSRSGIASFALVYFMDRFFAHPQINFKKLFYNFRFFLLLALIVLIAIHYFDLYERILTAIEVRFLKSGKSTDIHTEILFYGFFNAFESIKTTIFGHGFMSAPFYIYETFLDVGSEWKYVNFHSDYATMIFETGILGTALYYLNTSQLISTKKITRLGFSVFALVLLQGIFYQQFNFHYFWVVLVITVQIIENKKDFSGLPVKCNDAQSNLPASQCA